MQQQQQIHNNASDANADKSKKQPRKRYDRKKQSKIKKDETLTRAQARAWRYSIITFLVIFCLLGVKNAFIPPKSLTPAEVSSIAMQTMGETGFPMESGAAIAKTFAAAYIPINNDNAARAILANFYNGDKFDSIKNVLKRPSGGASLKSANANRSVGLPSRRVQQPVNICLLYTSPSPRDS